MEKKSSSTSGALLLVILTLAAGFLIGSDDVIKTDVVTVTDVDTLISAEETKAGTLNTACEIPSVGMSHFRHDAEGLKCIECHHKHDNDSRIKQCAQCHKGLAGMDHMHKHCGTCHQKEWAGGTDCGTCHNDGKIGNKVFTAESHKIKLMQADIPHKAHREHTKECDECHKGKAKEDWEDPANYPKMDQCLVCHDQKQASGRCDVCHGHNMAGIQPESHRHQWMSRVGHGEEARYKKNECMACHQESQCNQCHQGQGKMDIHPPGYRFVHGMDAKMKRSDCSMCHQTKNMCSRCHEGRR